MRKVRGSIAEIARRVGDQDYAVHDRFGLGDVAAVFVAGTLGALCAWTMRRYSTLSVRNAYLPALVSAGALALAVWLKAWSLVSVTAPVTSFCLSASLCGRRWRLAP